MAIKMVHVCVFKINLTVKWLYCVDDVCCGKHREGRLKQEMENVRQQNDWLNKELQEKIHELMTSRKEKVSYGFQCFAQLSA